MAVASKEISAYFVKIEKGVQSAFKLASEARKKGFDPEQDVDVVLTNTMAQRVEGLISVVAPKLKGSGMTKRIHELEKKHGTLAWEVALIIAEEVAKEKFCKFTDKREAMEVGIRTGFAYHTLGIVAAPLEGFIELKIKKRRDGKEYFAPRFAGPVRGAGGTGASVCLLIADYVRGKMGYDVYDPDESEINRFITELQDYHDRVTNLQYRPSREEIRCLVTHLPVEIDGEPTEEMEVSNYKDLLRVDTNRIRSGVCLVLSMLALKAPKLWKRIQKFPEDLGIDWGFLSEFLEIQKRVKAHETEHKDTENVRKVLPNYTFISDIVAGRPILTHPMRFGGFRLRYGRTRASGFSAAAIHPATMSVLNKYVATGTQLKIERPGKAAALTPCDTIDGPIVKLTSGDVVRLDTEQKAKQVLPNISEILFLGDMLFNYGDFSENNHFLVSAGYCEEWWILDVEKAAVDRFGSLDTEKLAQLVHIPEEFVAKLFRQPMFQISAKAAINIAQKLGAPLHPRYTYYWGGLSKSLFSSLLSALGTANIIMSNNTILKCVILLEKKSKRALELLGLPHIVASAQFVVIESEDALALLASLGIYAAEEAKAKLDVLMQKIEESESVLSLLNSVAGFVIKDKAGTFIGARMGRPEKAKMRKLTGSPHVLFPVSAQGGKLRSFQSALEAGNIIADFPLYYCSKDNCETIYPVCELCGKKTKKRVYCSIKGVVDPKDASPGGVTKSFNNREIDVVSLFSAAKKHLGMKTVPDLVKGVRGTSNKDHIPENLAKGLLRAKHSLCVNKDGTIRYDMSELPLTHFTPEETGATVEKLRELGYTHDIHNRPIESQNQVIELFPQDLVLPGVQCTGDEPADDVLFRIACFVDELLVSFYGLKPFYNFKTKKECKGVLVIGLAPHISAGMIGRVIGFSKTSACFAHPLWHAALRRDCDGDEACVLLLMDALLNFSRQFLPDVRGGRTMDAPLVLSSTLVPSEVDDMVHGIDVAWKYPLEFYEAALELKYPHEVSIAQLKSRLNTEKQYYDFGFTHAVSSINAGVTYSAYKFLPSMEEKLKGQMALAEKIRAVDADDVATLVIEKHFLKDIKGNMRKFSQQKFRCVECNEKYRRPPLIGKCTACGGKLIFTVSEGSIVKYLAPSMSLAEKYSLSPYLRQTLEILQHRITSVFGKEKERQEGLGKWFG